MNDAFDKGYWDSHWHQAKEHGAGRDIVANPYLSQETSGLMPGTALDAGCGEGAEAIWLADEGWQVTAADISAEALLRAAERAPTGGPAHDHVKWVEADLTVWEPDTPFDLVTTHYAHPAMPQLAFYDRISDWVAPGGTLLIVGHLHGSDITGGGDGPHGRGAGHHPPEEASVTAAGITVRLDPTRWDVVTAEEHSRARANRAGPEVELRDVVVRATRRL